MGSLIVDKYFHHKLLVSLNNDINLRNRDKFIANSVDLVKKIIQQF